MQVVGGPNSTGEGMNKINTGGKSRENCASQFWPAKLYQRGTAIGNMLIEKDVPILDFYSHMY